jgi:hypothetical protein
MSRASERKMRQRRAHGPQQAQRKADALTESRAVAKKQRKGAKGVETAMRQRGYVGGLVTRKVRHVGGRVKSVTVHIWKRVPQEAAA